MFLVNVFYTLTTQTVVHGLAAAATISLFEIQPPCAHPVQLNQKLNIETTYPYMHFKIWKMQTSVQSSEVEKWE